MDALQAQLDGLKQQVKEDFQFSMIARGRVTEHMNEVTRQVTEHMGEVTRELGQVQGKMARQEERFELMIDILQKMMNQVKADQVDPQRFSSLESRVEALERRQDPAA